MNPRNIALSPFIGSIIITAVILYGSMSPDTGEKGIIAMLGLDFKYSDKLLHGFFYFLLSISLYYGFIRQTSFPSKIIIHSYSIGVPVLVGSLVEIIQWNFIQSRHGEIADMGANFLGILLALFIYKIYRKYHRR